MFGDGCVNWKGVDAGAVVAGLSGGFCPNEKPVDDACPKPLNETAGLVSFFSSFANGLTVAPGAPKLKGAVVVAGLWANNADPLGVLNAKLSVGLSGALPLPFNTISLAGLSSIVTSCSVFGGVTGRIDGVVPNAKGLLDTSAAVVPLDVPPKLNAVEGAGVVVEVVEGPKAKSPPGFFSAVEDAPKENGAAAGFPSAGAVVGRGPNENGVAGGGVPNTGLVVSAAGGAVTGAGVDIGAAAGVD